MEKGQEKSSEGREDEGKMRRERRRAEMEGRRKG